MDIKEYLYFDRKFKAVMQKLDKVLEDKTRIRYFCDNCFNTFHTGKFLQGDSDMYDDICPFCGAPGMTFEELIEEYKTSIKEGDKDER